MKRDLIYLAGEKALAEIRQAGLGPDRVAVLAGAAGGPKGLALGGLDSALFTEWFPRNGGRKTPLFLLGNSIAAWRFAALCRADAAESLRGLHEAYISQFYVTDARPENVTREARRGLNSFMDEDGAREVLSHPFARLCFLADRARGWAASRIRWRYVASMAMAAGVNALCRSGLGLFFERVLFHDDRLRPPFWNMPGFRLHHVALTPANLREALLASGSIPLVMNGVTGIPGPRPACITTAASSITIWTWTCCPAATASFCIPISRIG